MPVEFYWVKENVLAFGPYPEISDLEELAKSGFKAIINLTEDNPRDKFIKEKFLSLVNIPLSDFGVPSAHQLLIFVRNMNFFERIKAPVFMHCIGGRGRSGTFAAIYLTMKGLSPEEAISEVRRIREGAIETTEQERFIYFSYPFISAFMNKREQAFFNAKNIIAILRKKCPWDSSQTHETLINSLLDEAYEVIEAIREKNNLKLKEELGDLLIQPLIQAQIEEEKNSFSIYDSIEIMLDKLIRRHPHIFGDKVVETADAVMNQWTQIKSKESNNDTHNDLINEIMKVSNEASSYGFDWENALDIFEKFREELFEIGSAIRDGNLREIEEELGDAFFALFNIARFLKVDPVKALERGRRKFEQRFRLVQRMIEKDGKNPSSMTAEELDDYWVKAKTLLKS